MRKVLAVAIVSLAITIFGFLAASAHFDRAAAVSAEQSTIGSDQGPCCK